MIKMLTASTAEIDIPEAAAEEITNQLDLENNLLENSVGIITCTSEFIETGVARVVSEVLPFTTLGMTTLACGTNSNEGLDMLSLSVYTADDVEFVTGVSDSISKKNMDSPIANLYDNTRRKFKKKTEPGLIIPFGPLVSDVSGDKIIGKLHEKAGDIPVFGSMACSPSFDFDKSFVLYNGHEYEDTLAILMMGGNVNPRFIISTISDDRITKQKAIITESEGSVLKEVNGLNLLEYMQTIGLSHDEDIKGSSSIPFVVDYGDGTKPSVRGIYNINDEGHAFCGGEMPVGGTLSIGALDPEDIIKTAGQAVEEALSGEEVNGMIMFPCQARNHLLEVDYLAEISRVRDKIDNKFPFHLAYSGGEVCPAYDDMDRTVNRYHNFTFISCVL